MNSSTSTGSLETQGVWLGVIVPPPFNPPPSYSYLINHAFPFYVLNYVSLMLKLEFFFYYYWVRKISWDHGGFLYYPKGAPYINHFLILPTSSLALSISKLSQRRENNVKKGAKLHLAAQHVLCLLGRVWDGSTGKLIQRALSSQITQHSFTTGAV